MIEFVSGCLSGFIVLSAIAAALVLLDSAIRGVTAYRRLRRTQGS